MRHALAIASLIAVSTALASCSKLEESFGTEDLPEGLYASISIARGGEALADLVIELDYEASPLYSANFVGLASGMLAAAEGGTPVYEGLSFYKRLEGVGLFAGNPQADGGIGWFLPDMAGRPIDGPGLLAMASLGPDTASSAFVLSLSPVDGGYPPELSDDLCAFGAIVKGIDALGLIAEGDTIARSRVVAKGAKAREFLEGVKDFQRMLDAAWKARKELGFDAQARDLEALYKDHPALKRSPLGLLYEITKEGSGPLPSPGEAVRLHFRLRKLDGTVLYDTRSRTRPFAFTLSDGQALPALEEAAAYMAPGEKRFVLAPPELCYGGEGLRDDWGYEIKPWSWLIFEDLELLTH